MKKLLILLVLGLALVGCAKSDTQLAEEGYVLNPTENGYVLNPTENGYVFEQELPAPRDLEKTYKPAADAAEVACTENVYAASCSSIGVDNLDEYLNRDDVLYFDVRDFKDYTMKHFRNFEVIPYFAYIFNAEAHNDEMLVQLYGGAPKEPVAVYAESDAILNALFPKDKVLFIMCQSGGRVVQLMQILEAKGYDMSLIYNIGGVGQYTDARFKPFLTDTAEFGIDATYRVDQANRNN